MADTSAGEQHLTSELSSSLGLVPHQVLLLSRIVTVAVFPYQRCFLFKQLCDKVIYWNKSIFRAKTAEWKRPWKSIFSLFQLATTQGVAESRFFPGFLGPFCGPKYPILNWVLKFNYHIKSFSAVKSSFLSYWEQFSPSETKWKQVSAGLKPYKGHANLWSFLGLSWVLYTRVQRPWEATYVYISI